MSNGIQVQGHAIPASDLAAIGAATAITGPTGPTGATGATGPGFTGAPSVAGATGTAGKMAYDSGFIYICVATNTWKRVGVSTW